MKKTLMTLLVILLTVALFVGCGEAQPDVTTATTQPTTETTAPSESQTTEEPTEEPTAETEMDYYANAYAEQIERYHTALAEQWDEGAYIQNEMSALAMHYYEGTALENVGYTFIDLDNNGVRELIIGAILNAEEDPAVLELWTLKDEVPTMLAQGSSRNRYYLQYDAEVDLWSLANEAESSATNHAVYFLQIYEGELNITQGIIYDAAANEENPWFMTYDLDWDVSNDTPTDEEMANAVIDTGRFIYIAVDYIPYSQYQ